MVYKNEHEHSKRHQPPPYTTVVNKLANLLILCILTNYINVNNLLITLLKNIFVGKCGEYHIFFITLHPETDKDQKPISLVLWKQHSSET